MTLTTTDEGGVVLNDGQTKALARFLAARLLRNVAEYGDHLDWEDVPMLTQGSWEAVAARIGVEADRLSELADVEGIDSRWLWGEVS